jgi:Flp pilus assembly protein TadD
MRKIVVILTCSTVVLLLGFAGYRGYELWKQSHWMSLAKNFAAKGDAHNEFLSLEQVLNSNARNVEACRMMANLAGASRSSSALVWRERVVELEPDSLGDRLALAQTAITSHDFATAENALAGVDAAGKNTAPYFSVSGTLALAMSKPDEAEADFAQAVRLDPSNPAPQFNLAVIELHDTNALDVEEARIALKRISMNSTNAFIRNQADRELIINSLQIGDDATALSRSRELALQTNATFADKILRLDVLKKTKNGEYGYALESYEREAANNSDDLLQLTMWLMEQNLSSKALGWLQSLPVNIQTNQPAALLIAQCQMLDQDWSDLQNFISKQDWGELDFTRHAYLSRALRQQGLYEASKAEWDVAMRSANGRDADLTGLFHLAAQWKWQDEAQQTLTTIVNNYPQEQWASKELAAALYASGSTRPLMQLFSIQANRNPNDWDAKNNLALTALLLRAQELNPYDLARDTYQVAPTNSYYACTYAFSLYLQGKNDDALKIMQQLTPKDLKDNSTDGYYGLILKATGDTGRANVYLTRSLQGQLLPEERALFQQALAGL